MSIKDKIESLPDDAIISHIEYDHYAGGGYIDCSHADLKALSASHTALIRQLRVMASAAEHKADLLPVSFKIAWDIVEEAEKL